jgi:hypothetical protein
MTDVRLSTKTLDTWSIATDDANIMKHGCSFQEILIKSQFRMTTGYQESPVSNSPTMHKEDVLQSIILLVKMINY